MVRMAMWFWLIAGLLEITSPASATAAATTALPTAAAVYEELGRLWQEGDAETFLGYIDGLKRDCPDYVPTRLASILSDSLDGVSMQRVSRELSALSEELKQLLPWVSPAFEEGIRDKVRYYSKLAKSLDADDIQYEVTVRRPKVLEGTISAYGAYQLILLAPEIVLPFEGGDPPGSLKLEPVKGEGNDIDYEEALEIIQPPSEESQLRQRAAFAVLGASQRPEAIDELCAIIRAPYAISPTRAAEALSGFGETAVPALIDLLRQPVLPNVKKNVIWALVRTGVRRSDVRNAVEQEHSPFLDSYIERALRYL